MADRFPERAMKIKISVACCLLAVLQAQAQAQEILMCKDASGRTITSDRPLPECSGRAVRQLDRNEMVRREIPAPLTPEQKRQKQLEEERIKAEQAEAAERKQQDKAILARFRNEGDIEVARKRMVDVVQEQARRESAVLAVAEKRKKEIEAEVARSRNQKSSALQYALEEAEQAVVNSRQKLHDYVAEIAQINEKFAQTLKRYRELTAVKAAGKTEGGALK